MHNSVLPKEQKKNWYVKIHSRRAVPNKVGEGH